MPLVAERKASSTCVLERFLYDDNNVVDRLYQGTKGRTLRRATTQRKTNHSHPSPAVPKLEGKDAASVGRLEKEMEAVTDLQFLRVAQGGQASKPVTLFIA